MTATNISFITRQQVTEEEIQKWLLQNTVTCKLGKVSKTACEQNRRKPTLNYMLQLSEEVWQQINRNKVPSIMPPQCENCEGWDYYKSLSPVAPADIKSGCKTSVKKSRISSCRR